MIFEKNLLTKSVGRETGEVYSLESNYTYNSPDEETVFVSAPENNCFLTSDSSVLTELLSAI